jgi:hypothetical protein
VGRSGGNWCRHWGWRRLSDGDGDDNHRRWLGNWSGGDWSWLGNWSGGDWSWLGNWSGGDWRWLGNWNDGDWRWLGNWNDGDWRWLGNWNDRHRRRLDNWSNGDWRWWWFHYGRRSYDCDALRSVNQGEFVNRWHTLGA